MTAHSTILGGSIASRRLHCPASYQESLRAPPGLTSIYAEHGTALHEAMAHWLRNPDIPTLVDSVFNDHVITQEDDVLLTDAWNALADLQEQHGGGFTVSHLELTVKFPGVPGAFGTGDVILQSRDYLILVDFKFGAGVQVFCRHPDTDELNAQLLFYLSGCRHLAKKRQFVIAIIQPTFTPHLSYAPVERKLLNQFEARLHDAVADALSDNPTRLRGEWCRFASCKVTCPLWTGPLLDLTVLGKPPTAKPPADTAWGEWLSAAKRLVDSALAYQKDIDQALMEHLKAGGLAPGFALKQQVKNRKWLEDSKQVGNALKRLGLSDEAIWQHKLQTFAVVDAAAKRLGVTVPDELRPRPQSSDLTLTYQGDPSAVDVRQLTVEFSTALKRLANQQTGTQS